MSVQETDIMGREHREMVVDQLRGLGDYNPAFQTLHSQYALGATLYETTGASEDLERAMRAVGAEEPGVIYMYGVPSLAREVLKREDTERAIPVALKLAEILAGSEKTALSGVEVLANVAETKPEKPTMDKIVGLATKEAVRCIEERLSDDTREFYFFGPAEPVLDLSLASVDSQLIELAVDSGLSEHDNHDLALDLAELLKKLPTDETGTVNAGYRDTVVEELLKVVGRSRHTFVSLFSNDGVVEQLTVEEKRRLALGIYKGGNAPVVTHKKATWPDSKLKDKEAAIAHTSEQLKRFNEFMTSQGLWESVVDFNQYEKLRSKLQRREAASLLRKSLQVSYLPETGKAPGRDIARTASKIIKNIGDSPLIDDPLETDRTLLYDYASPLSPFSNVAKKTVWQWSILHSRITSRDLTKAKPGVLDEVYQLRDMLSPLSVARLQLNAALHKAGDKTALLDSVRCVTGYRDAVVMKALDTYDAETAIDGQSPDIKAYSKYLLDLL